ncbi:MAG: hypothetical protein AB7R40_23240 [Nitrospiraceae bacterium]
MFKKLKRKIRLFLVQKAHAFLRDNGFVILDRGTWALIRGQFWNVEDRVKTARTKKVMNHQRNVLLKASRRLRRLLSDSDRPLITTPRPNGSVSRPRSLAKPKAAPSSGKALAGLVIAAMLSAGCTFDYQYERACDAGLAIADSQADSLVMYRDGDCPPYFEKS